MPSQRGKACPSFLWENLSSIRGSSTAVDRTNVTDKRKIVAAAATCDSGSPLAHAAPQRFTTAGCDIPIPTKFNAVVEPGPAARPFEFSDLGKRVAERKKDMKKLSVFHPTLPTPS